MAKKKSSGKSGPAGPPPDLRGAEKAMADLHRLLEEQEFESEEEVNAFMQNLMTSGPLPESTPETPLGKAQALMYKAWETKSRSQRIKLAKKALAVSGDCADAYVLLAEESSKNLEELLDYYQQGVDAGKRAIGDEFDKMVGYFWGVLETRPYMRAMAGLAEGLWAFGERKRAIDCAQEMLRLNPNDNQGERYILLHWLLEAEQNKEADDLIKRYPDDYSATWHYSKALLLFRKYGTGKRSNEQLAKAVEFNSYVPPYLLTRRFLPSQIPDYYTPHEDNEAVLYVMDARVAWLQTNGALMWLREITDKPG